MQTQGMQLATVKIPGQLVQYSAGGTGKTSLEMQTQSSFTTAGWDFAQIWDIDNTHNSGYPFLRWQQFWPEIVSSQVKVYLEGAYDITSSIMLPGINAEITLTSPYIDALSISAMPANIVDWVYIQLRSTPTGAPIFEQSFLLQDDGFIVDVNGNGVSYMMQADDYYVVVVHRNHLAIMSDTPHTFNNTSTQICDLTGNNTTYNSGVSNEGVSMLETGVYGMIAGETTDPASTGATITDADKSLINSMNGDAGYLLADTNFSAIITDTDKGFININNGKTCQVPGIVRGASIANISASQNGIFIEVENEIEAEQTQENNKILRKTDSYKRSLIRKLK